MRTHARSLSALASALLLAATAATMPGCGKTERNKDPRADDGQGVFVVVTYENGKAKILDANSDNKKITLRKNKDWAVWYSPAGLVYVDAWSPELPFDSPPKHDKEKKILKSGPAKKKGTFTYVAKLVLTGDSEDKGKEIDPIIEVMESN